MVGITGYVTGAVNGIGNHVSNLSVGEAIIFDIAVILIIAAIFAFIAKILKQPLILGYVLGWRGIVRIRMVGSELAILSRGRHTIELTLLQIFWNARKRILRFTEVTCSRASSILSILEV